MINKTIDDMKIKGKERRDEEERGEENSASKESRVLLRLEE